MKQCGQNDMCEKKAICHFIPRGFSCCPRKRTGNTEAAQDVVIKRRHADQGLLLSVVCLLQTPHAASLCLPFVDSGDGGRLQEGQIFFVEMISNTRHAPLTRWGRKSLPEKCRVFFLTWGGRG